MTAIVPPSVAGSELVVHKGQPNGYGSLDATNHQPVSEAPLSVVTSGQQGGTVAAPTAKTQWTFQPVDTTKGPAQIVTGGGSFNGVWDNVLYYGWNVGSGGGRVNPNDSAWYIALEHSYVANPGGHVLEEGYFEWTAADGSLTIRPLFFHIDATAKTATTDMGITSLSMTDPANNAIQWGSWGEQGLTLGGPTGPNLNQSLALQPGVTSESSIQLYRHASNNVPVWSIATAAAAEAIMQVNGFSSVYFFKQRMAIGAEDNSAGLTIQDQGGGIVLQTLDGPLGQAQDHYRATNAAKSVVYSRITSQGYIATAKNVIPDDVYVNNGEVSLWLDATPGATKMMFKAKDSGGTVRTGSVALA